jgi:hypothetical protein
VAVHEILCASHVKGNYRKSWPSEVSAAEKTNVAYSVNRSNVCNVGKSASHDLLQHFENYKVKLGFFCAVQRPYKIALYTIKVDDSNKFDRNKYEPCYQ